MYNLNASISGGGEYSTFNTSLGYFDQQGIMEFLVLRNIMHVSMELLRKDV